ncbi:hypothetical protein DITRI_Ditri06bG0029800 [Diplodiscus trichospermus]
MEVRITSRETIKPSSREVHLLKPFKLSFSDQLVPPTYVSFILFYAQSQSSVSSSNSAQISAHLKRSLSETLNHFYPLSGRPRDNLCIHSYEEGVPYIEARLNCCLSDYLQHVEIEELNQLLPFKPFCYLPDPTAPLLAVQLTTFDCGGIALGVSSSQFFPPMDRMPPKTLSKMKSMWFNYEGRRKTRTFIFDEKSIDTLKSQVRSKSVERPTRVQAPTAFIWKYAMLASRSASGISKPFLATTYIELQNLAYLVQEELKTFNKDYLDRQRSGEDVKFITEKLNDMLAKFAEGDYELYMFISSLKSKLHEADFGWGEPIFHGMPPGVVSPIFNLTIFKEIAQHKQIEAWITLEEKSKAILENDPEFLAFASPNRHFKKIKILTLMLLKKCARVIWFLLVQ